MAFYPSKSIKIPLQVSFNSNLPSIFFLFFYFLFLASIYLIFLSHLIFISFFHLSLCVFHFFFSHSLPSFSLYLSCSPPLSLSISISLIYHLYISIFSLTLLLPHSASLPKSLIIFRYKYINFLHFLIFIYDMY